MKLELKQTLLILLALAIVIVSILSHEKKGEDTAVMQHYQPPVIIIDPGHGGVDGGAVGVSGTVEKGINLEIALKLREILEGEGLSVVMTRETDISIHDESAETIREKKRSDLQKRLELTELFRESVLISIHQNISDISSVKGAQLFYSPNAESSKLLAQYIQQCFNDTIGKTRTISAAGKNLYLFYNAKNTAVLAECGFLSNSEEEALLRTGEYQQKIAQCIADGLLLYLSNK